MENAFDIVEKIKLNAVSELRFSMPADDPKVEFLDHFNYVQWENGDWYVLLDIDERDEDGTGKISYYCEHVITTLLNNVIRPLEPFQSDNQPTRHVLERILDLQTTKNWVLGDCEFSRLFSYGWNNEKLMRTVLYVPTLFDQSYRWRFDTSKYPWTLHLDVFNTDALPEFYIEDDYNLISSNRVRKGRDITTRLFALGAGDGINQLTFKDINDDRAYVENADGLSKYGLIENTWEDGRFENEESLLARARQLVSGLGMPKLSYTVKIAELNKETGQDFDTAEVGKIVQWGELKTYITAVERHHDADGADEIELSNTPEDIAQSIASLADRQRIAAVYGHGATNIWSVTVDRNCGPSDPAVIPFYIPPQTINANRINVYWEATYFESYSRGVKAAQAQTRASTSTNSQVQASTNTTTQAQTSSSDGGQNTSTASNTQTSNNVTSAASSLYTSGYPEFYLEAVRDTQPTTLNFNISGSASHTHTYYDGPASHNHAISHTHNVTVTIPSHTHGFSFGSHTHTLSIPGHGHSVTIPGHSHDVTIPAHNHEVEYGIWRGTKANAFTITLDGKVTILIPEREDFDIYPYLSEGKKNTDISGTHRLEFRPDTLSGVRASVTPQIFIRSE